MPCSTPRCTGLRKEKWHRAVEGGTRIPRGRLAAAEFVEPAGERFLVGGGEVNELDAHADPGLYDAHDHEAFDDLALVGQSHARATAEGQRLAGADEAAAQRNVAGHAGTVGTGFEVDEVGIRGERIADGVAAVAYGRASRVILGDAVVHRDDVAHVFRPRGERTKRGRVQPAFKV